MKLFFPINTKHEESSVREAVKLECDRVKLKQLRATDGFKIKGKYLFEYEELLFLFIFMYVYINIFYILYL